MLPFYSSPSCVTSAQVKPHIRHLRPIIHPLFLVLLHAYYGTDPEPTTSYQRRIRPIFLDAQAAATAASLDATTQGRVASIRSLLNRSQSGGIFSHAHSRKEAHTSLLAAQLGLFLSNSGILHDHDEALSLSLSLSCLVPCCALSHASRWYHDHR